MGSSQYNPATGPPTPLWIFNAEALKILWRFSSSPATIAGQLLYYCQKKAHYEHLSSNQSCVFVSCCLRAAAAAAAATVIVQMIPKRKHRLEQTPCYAVAKLPATAVDRMTIKQTVESRTK